MLPTARPAGSHLSGPCSLPMAYVLLAVLVAFASEDVSASRRVDGESKGGHAGWTVKKAATRYFEVWNQHDVPGLKSLLTAEATLRDWNVEKSGSEAVAKANAQIFADVPGIKIEVLTVHVSAATRTAACEILVKLNNGKGDELKVVDIISFDAQGKILSVRAYKG